MLETTGMDKVLHFIISYLIALVDPVLSVAAGVGKELFDHARGAGADAFDLLADGLGIILAVIS